MKKREIKFRAWDTWDKKHGKMVAPTDAIFYRMGIMEIARNKNLKIMQYTGLKDKNGVEIYEGDIVCRYHNHKECKDLPNTSFYTHLTPPVPFSENTYHSVVRYEEGKYGIFYDYGDFKDPSDKKNGVEVIGNIYENPELLKKNK